MAHEPEIFPETNTLVVSNSSFETVDPALSSTEQPVSNQLICRVVEGYTGKIGFKLSPHSLRATFVTLALEGRAKLDQVQYAVGHADPLMTERYQKRKLNFDRNAVDFIQL